MGRSLSDDTLRSGQGHREAGERVPQQGRSEHRQQEAKTVYHLSGQNYHLSPRQSAMLRDIGTFRTITADSLQKHVYRGDEDRFRKDLRNLTDQRLVAVLPNPRGRDRYVSLTRSGKNLTEAHLRTTTEQSLYSGIVKKRELRHDAAIYDVYQKEAQAISKSGGTVKRVVLDFELKKNVNRQLARIQNLSPAERECQRQQIAEEHGLKIVNGKIQIPDVRVEYESQEQEQCKVDLECVTGHYKARQIAAKAAAGFKLYNQDYHGRSAERGEDLIGEVMSL
jgi:DNA-binding MarR family transcriptional regulator